MEIEMFRKLTLALVTAASLGTIALSPSVASAHGMGGHGGHGGGFHGGGYHGGHWGGHHRHFWGRSAFYVGGSCYKTVFTEFGPRRINVCRTEY
jgi:hypothetical protein